MDLHVTVTQADINRGVKNHCYYCPVAIAINRAMGWPAKSGRTIVGNQHVELLDTHARVKMLSITPKAVRGFINSYDHLPKKQSKPFSFDLHFIKDKPTVVYSTTLG